MRLIDDTRSEPGLLALSIYLGSPVREGVEKLAARQSKSPATFIQDLLALEVSKTPGILSKRDAARLAEHQEYVEFVDSVIDRFRDTDFPDNVTHLVFIAIEEEKPQLYRRVARGEKALMHHYNKLTGARVKERLDAETRPTRPGGPACKGRVSKGLITSFSKLWPKKPKSP